MDPTDHLFRRESGRMVAALTRIFGVHNLALAEDVVQDAFCRALEVWKFRGIPENPSAWLMATAKNRALDIIRREKRVRPLDPDLEVYLESEWTMAHLVAEIFDAQAIRDDELRMMFSCCHPQLPEIAQVALILNVCCGFGVHEVASAFLISNAAMEKRITRAKKVFTSSEKLFELKDERDFTERLTAVQRALYLLFNEGYHGASSESPIRSELCFEAMRQCDHLCRNPLAAKPSTFALSALMSLNAARLPARIDPDGNLTSLFDQDRNLWDKELIALGQERLARSATGDELSEFHVEAGIASIHAAALRAAETDWRTIVSLYDVLLSLRHSPVVALNRAIAIAQAEGPERGLAEIDAIQDKDRLAGYPFFSAALAELEVRAGRRTEAMTHYQAAIELARNPSEIKFLENRLMECRSS